jgi:hypothetical protein
MKIQINKIRSKEMPSKFGTGWKLYEAKFYGKGETIYQLSGFNSKYMEKLASGSFIDGFFGQKSFNGKNGQVTIETFNKITPEYLYDLMEKNGLQMDASVLKQVTAPAQEPKDEWKETSGPDQAPDDGFEGSDPGF